MKKHVGQWYQNSPQNPSFYSLLLDYDKEDVNVKNNPLFINATSVVFYHPLSDLGAFFDAGRNLAVDVEHPAKIDAKFLNKLTIKALFTNEQIRTDKNY